MENHHGIIRADNPADSIVGVWLGAVNDKLVGSAIFVTPSIVLTARHVVQERTEHGWGSMRENLFLGPQKDTIQLSIDSSRVHCHPEFDIALIRLRQPQGKQACVSISSTRHDYRGRSVVCYGVDAIGDRDQTSSYKVGLQLDGAYLFDHRVKEGYSGGAVGINDRVEIIGVISQGGVNDQESLFVPLYLIQDWLGKLGATHDDSEIAKFLEEFRPRSSIQATRKNLINDIRELAKFIERPKEAFEHVADEIIANKRGLKLCLCLSTSSDSDVPEEFAIALALKLSTEGAPASGNRLLELAQKDQFHVHGIKHSVWWAKSYDEFRHRCLEEIFESLQGSRAHNPADMPRSDDDYRREIRKLLQNREQPSVFLTTANHRVPKGLWSWRNRAKAVRSINRRFDWLTRFNCEWLERFEDPDQQPLIGVFCIFAEYKDVKSIARCFRLDKITEENFSDWKVDIQRWLDSTGRYADGQVYAESSRFFRHVSNQFNLKNLRFPLTYEDFKIGIEETGRSYEGEGK